MALPDKVRVTRVVTYDTVEMRQELSEFSNTNPSDADVLAIMAEWISEDFSSVVHDIADLEIVDDATGETFTA